MSQQRLIPTDDVQAADGLFHYQIVVLRDDQLDLIADRVAAKLREEHEAA